MASHVKFKDVFSSFASLRVGVIFSSSLVSAFLRVLCGKNLMKPQRARRNTEEVEKTSAKDQLLGVGHRQRRARFQTGSDLGQDALLDQNGMY